MGRKAPNVCLCLRSIKSFYSKTSIIIDNIIVNIFDILIIYKVLKNLDKITF